MKFIVNLCYIVNALLLQETEIYPIQEFLIWRVKHIEKQLLGLLDFFQHVHIGI